MLQKSGPFRGHAWDMLRTVAPGHPVTYTEYAALSGNAKAVRAAASACAFNAAALFVPCHRVIRTDGSLGGFRWGLAIKESLLARERELAPALKEGGTAPAVSWPVHVKMSATYLPWVRSTSSIHASASALEAPVASW